MYNLYFRPLDLLHAGVKSDRRMTWIRNPLLKKARSTTGGRIYGKDSRDMLKLPRKVGLFWTRTWNQNHQCCTAL